MNVKLDKRIEIAFKKGFWTNRNGLEFISPKKYCISISIRSDNFEMESFSITKGSRLSFYDLEGYGMDWALTKEELRENE